MGGVVQNEGNWLESSHPISYSALHSRRLKTLNRRDSGRRGQTNTGMKMGMKA